MSGYPGPNNAVYTRPLKFRLWDLWNKRYHMLKPSSWLNQKGQPQYEWIGDDIGAFESGFEFDSHLMLEQFTGLQDSNGVDIYENDIVEQRILGHTYRYHVKWDVAFASFRPFASDFYYSSYESGYDDKRTPAGKVVVAGNVHQHSHLLNPSAP